MKLVIPCVWIVMLGLVASVGHCQDEVADTEDVSQLRKEIELLRKENELLKKKIEQLQSEQEAEPETEPDDVKKPSSKAPSLSDLIVKGAVLNGTFRADSGGGHGEITLTITELTGNKFKADAQRVQMQNYEFVANANGEVHGRFAGSKLTYWNVGASNTARAELLLKEGAL